MKVLVVKSDFGDYRRGDEITDTQAVEKILAGEQAEKVLVTERDEPPPAASDSAPAAEKPKKSSK